jgi:hypothetical protein
MRRSPRGLCAWALCALLAPSAVRAESVAKTSDPGERSFDFKGWLGLGVDSNVLHDPQSSAQAALLRLALESEVEPRKDLRLNLSGWFEEHLPHYDLNEAYVQLLVMFRRRLTPRWGVRVGSYTEYHRELTTYVAGTILTHGSTLLNEVAEHATGALQARFGRFDLEVGPGGHAKWVGGTANYGVFGVDGSAALRWVPLAGLALRLRYLVLFEDVRGLALYDLAGDVTPAKLDLQLLTNQVDFQVRGRLRETVDLFLRYELAFIDDNFVGYLRSLEHRLIAGVRWEPERRWVIDCSGWLVQRGYPLRAPSAENQNRDLELELIAEAELWLVKHFGLFARYQFDGEVANPFGLIYLRHAGLLGVVARAGARW